MLRSLALVLIFLVLATDGLAEERPRGLLWNRSGLAATLPLQIKTDAGADYLLRLRDVETGEAVLAAYIRGGEFFRVLVPPGRFELQFAIGSDWQGEAALFGPDTWHFVLEPPLSFGATVSRKEGHLIDFRDQAEATIRDLAICQRMALDVGSLRRPHLQSGSVGSIPETSLPSPSQYPVPRYDLQSRVCD